MFVKTKRKPLKYLMLTRCNGGEWVTGSTLTNWNKAHEYAINASNDGFDCAMVVTRGGKFEYEKRYYDQSGCAINQIRKKAV